MGNYIPIGAKKERTRPRVWIDMILSWVETVFGIYWLCIFSLICMVGTYEALDSSYEYVDRTVAIPAVILCFGLAIGAFLIIRASFKTRKLIGTFRYYSTYLVRDKSIADLARCVNEPEEDVRAKIEQMCRRGYFSGKFDPESNKLVFNMPATPYVARCPGCGATTNIYKTGDTCRYCGNPLEAKEESTVS